VKAFSEDSGKCGFADAKRAFDDDEARGLGAALRNPSALGGGGFVGRHQRDYSRVVQTRRLLE
jgi:hypothetical protein